MLTTQTNNLNIIRGNYAIVKADNLVILCEHEPWNSTFTVLKDVELIVDNGVLTMTGEQIFYKCAYNYKRKYFNSLSEILALSDDERPRESEIKYGFKNFWKRFKKHQHPYLEDLYRLEKTKPVKLITDHWTIREK